MNWMNAPYPISILCKLIYFVCHPWPIYKSYIRLGISFERVLSSNGKIDKGSPLAQCKDSTDQVNACTITAFVDKRDTHTCVKRDAEAGRASGEEAAAACIRQGCHGLFHGLPTYPWFVLSSQAARCRVSGAAGQTDQVTVRTGSWPDTGHNLASCWGSLFTDAICDVAHRKEGVQAAMQTLRSRCDHPVNGRTVMITRGSGCR